MLRTMRFLDGIDRSVIGPIRPIGPIHLALLEPRLLL